MTRSATIILQAMIVLIGLAILGFLLCERVLQNAVDMKSENDLTV